MNGYADELDKIQDKQEKMLETLIATATRLDEICKKFDKFLETGGARCASHAERIHGAHKSIKILFTWLAGLTATLFGAFLGKLLGGPGWN